MSAHDQRRQQLLALVRAEPSAARLGASRRERASWLAVLAVASALLAIAGVHIASRPHALVAASASVWAFVAVGATALATFRGRSMLGPPRTLALAGAIAVAPILVASWFAMPWAEVTRAVEHQAAADASCFALTLLLAAAPLCFLLRVRREGDPVHPAVTGAIAGAAAGAWGTTLIDLHCELIDPSHVVLAHILPVVILLAAGAALGRSVLAITSSRRPRTTS